MSFSFAKPGSMFGLNTTNTQPQTSLFGASTQQQPQPPQTGSLFQNSLLGQPPQPNQQQGAGGSLFSSTLGQPAQQQGQQTGQPGSLFSGFGQQGAQSANTQPQQSGNSLFSNTATQSQQPQQPPQPPSLFTGFGNTSTNTNNAFGQSFTGFGSQQGMQRQATLPAFGAGASTAPAMNSLFRQPSQQPPPANLPAQSMGGPPFVKSTKFNDLSEDVKRMLEAIDAHIQGRVQISNDLKQRKVGEEATKGQDLLRSVHKDLVSAITVLQADMYHTRDLKTKTDQTVQDTIVATRIVDGSRNPQQYGQHLKTYATFPLEFFERVTEDMRNRLRWYKTTIEQIERKLSSAASQTQPTPHAIASTLQAQYATFVALASRTAALDAELQKIKALYMQLWRAKTGSMRDPFNELDRGHAADFGLDTLSGK